jgi:hypothetical protein
VAISAGLVGSQFGLRTPLGQHTAVPPQQAQPPVAELFSNAIEFDSGQATALRRAQIGEAMVNYSARGGHRGSVPWPGRGRSQRARNPIGRLAGDGNQRFPRNPSAGAKR